MLRFYTFTIFVLKLDFENRVSTVKDNFRWLLIKVMLFSVVIVSMWFSHEQFQEMIFYFNHILTQSVCYYIAATN